ncbi:phage head morphogenesis protein [Desulfonema ishimotonii]|uniref:Phage head morphogenesis protein n=1 Tax=Desulfonema ishimotonii TaxID=45657 RepID=A0A401FZU9_9BACT|nr:phage minor head protein [Desulfonema ishimotonii]GBC62495.1 phage head morphogenesis protein [Desulfonema ishimotonii]
MADVTPTPLPMKEAKRFWKDKMPTAAKNFDALADAAHTKAFMVSGLNRMDQVCGVYEAMYQAIDAGETLAEFRARIPKIIADQGWNDYRTDLIFRTNIQSAYMSGRYAQMAATAKTRPYWQYSAINDSRTRPAHAYMHGKVFPADSPIWDTWYPPNGYKCRCGVKSLSERQLGKRGLKVSDDPTGKTFVPTDPKTGLRLPARKLRPDPGWSQNVGKDWLGGLSPSEIAEKDIAWRTAVTQPARMPSLATLDRRHLLPVSEADLLANGLSNDDYLRAFLSEFDIKDLNESKVVTLPGANIPMVVGRGLFADPKTGNPQIRKGGRERYVRLLARTLLNPYEIWMNPGDEGKGLRPYLTLIRLFRDADDTVCGGSVVVVSGRSWTSKTLFQTDAKPERILQYLKSQRKGSLLYREKVAK